MLTGLEPILQPMGNNNRGNEMRNLHILALLILSTIFITSCGTSLARQEPATVDIPSSTPISTPLPVITPLPTIDPKIKIAADETAAAVAKQEALDMLAAADAKKIADANLIEEQKKAKFKKIKADLLAENPKVSDVGIIGDFVVSLNKKIDSTDLVGNLYNLKQANGVFRFLYIGVGVSGKKPETIDHSMFQLVSTDGTTYGPDPTAAIYAKVDSKFFYEKINPGNEAHGYIVFDMPPEVKFRNLVLRMTVGEEHLDLNFSNY